MQFTDIAFDNRIIGSTRVHKEILTVLPIFLLLLMKLIPMLTPELKEKLRDKITKKIIRLKEDIVYLKENTKPISPENAIGRISRMDAINNKSVAENSLRQSESTLTRLEEALDNIDKPDYNLCNKCKEEIEIERLMFMPESRRCTKCARQST